MTSNPLFTRRHQPQEAANWKPPADLVEEMNAGPLGRAYGWFWYLRDGAIKKLDLPQGSKNWLKENEARAKSYIRKIVGEEPQLIQRAYNLAVEYATEPKAWSNRLR